MNDTKRQVLPNGLWVVATPIGNLEDVTPRIRMAIEEADLILCEDTRRTANLLAFFGSRADSGRLMRMDAYTSSQQIQKWVQALTHGKSFALVTDAGTPGISDPGAILVEAAHQAGVRVTPVPGPCSVVTLLSVSGFRENAFCFRGFFPRKENEKKQELQLALQSAQSGGISVNVWLDSPKRIRKTLEIVAESFPKALLCVGKELTKVYERVFWGEAAEVFTQVTEVLKQQGELGEWCFAIAFPHLSAEVSVEPVG